MEDLNNNKTLRIIHFNDVYNIEEYKEEPVGGAARFINGVQQKKQDNSIVLFSGDAYSPSMLSSLYDGVQMIEPLNKIGIDIACLGNHELDYGLEELVDLIKQNNFPWMMSNVYNALTESNIAETIDSKIIEKNGLKIGVMGLAEEEWLGFITEIDPNIIDYEDFINAAKRLCSYFKKENCDLIIALTHMRNPNDIKLAQNVPEIDLILGGHDHIKHIELLNNSNTLFLKSGTDFKQFSYNDIELVGDQPDKQKTIEDQNIYVIKNKWKVTVQFQEITQQIEPEPETKKHVEYYVNLSQKEMQKVIGYSNTDLDTRFSVIRAQETKWGNFFADVIRIDMDAEVSIINMGTVRSDTLIPKGEIIYDTINKMLPIHDTILSKEVNGKQLHQALENGVSKWPSYDGRFPAVSNIKFSFDATAPPMSRIKKEDIQVLGQPIDYERTYSCAMKYFLSIGKDGYEVFNDCKYIVDEESGTPHLNTIKNFFYSFKRDKKQTSTINNIGEEFNAKVSLIEDKQEQPPRTSVRKKSLILTGTAKRRSTNINSIVAQLCQNVIDNQNQQNESGLMQVPSSEQKMEMIKQQESIQNSKYYQYKSLNMIHGFKKSSDTNEDILVIDPIIDNRIVILNAQQIQKQE